MKNTVTLIGRVGKDPEVRKLESGMSVATFSLATSEKFKDKSGEKKEETQWHNIVVWGKLAEVADKYVGKGMLLCIDGKIKYRSYDDKEGNKKYVTEIVATGFNMLSGKKEEVESTDAAAPASEEGSDDLPF